MKTLEKLTNNLLNEANRIVIECNQEGENIGQIQDRIMNYQHVCAQRGIIPEFSINFKEEKLTLEHLTLFDLENNNEVLMSTHPHIKEGQPLPTPSPRADIEKMVKALQAKVDKVTPKLKKF